MTAHSRCLPIEFIFILLSKKVIQALLTRG
jgi:hypothetical protein